MAYSVGMALRTQPGELIARGNTSHLYAHTPGTVVKVLHRGIPAAWAEIEADITTQVARTGLRVPAVDSRQRRGRCGRQPGLARS